MSDRNRYLESLADTLGMSLKVDKGFIRGSTQRIVKLSPELSINIKANIISSYNSPGDALAIVVGKVVGDLGFMAYNYVDSHISECVEFMLLDFSKLTFDPANVFENEPDVPASELALRFDPGLLVHLRRLINEKKFTLIENRWIPKGTGDANTVLDVGGCAPDPQNVREVVTEFPTVYPKA